MALFPTTLSNPLNPDGILDVALTTALSEAQLNFPRTTAFTRLAITLVSIDESTSPPTFKHAGLNENVMHYSGSLLKVAAMYAAFELRKSANEFANSSRAADATRMFADMSTAFDATILNKVPEIANSTTVPKALKLPKYSSMFDAIPIPVVGGFVCVFKPSFIRVLEEMIVNGDNTNSTICVRNVGYGFLNGALKEAGLFNGSGIWLAGGFTLESATMPYVRINSVNDGMVGQATTTFQMAKLYANMFQGTLVDPVSSVEMLLLLTRAVTGKDKPWLARPGTKADNLGFAYLHDKIGLGGLKKPINGLSVASEGAILSHSDTGKKFIVVWQNSLNDTESLRAVSTLVDRAIKRALGLP